MLKECTRYEKSKLEAEQPWDRREFSSLEAKDLGGQVTDGSRIYLARE